MKELKATPGPWQIMNGGDIFGPPGGDSGDGARADSNDGWQIAEVRAYSAFVDGELVELGAEPRRANACLIAAAPELYEALLLATQSMHPGNDTDLAICNAALAKARGEA